MATIAGQRMSAETIATRAVVYAIGVPVPEPGRETRRLKQGAGHTVKNRANRDQGMQAHQERSPTYG